MVFLSSLTTLVLSNLNGTIMYATIWSKSSFGGSWVIERTHTIDYIKTLIGIDSFNESVEIKGRIYQIYPEGTNPNV